MRGRLRRQAIVDGRCRNWEEESVVDRIWDLGPEYRDVRKTFHLPSGSSSKYLCGDKSSLKGNSP